jgi:putative ABC transport system permease protein
VSLGVANSVTMSLHERTGEFGTLKALGTRNGDLFRLILVENAVLGFLGGLSGVLVGVVLAWAISAVGIAMPPPPNMNTGYTAIIRVVPWMLVLAFGVGWLATLLAAILPARRAARQPIVEALRANL